MEVLVGEGCCGQRGSATSGLVATRERSRGEGNESLAVM